MRHEQKNDTNDIAIANRNTSSSLSQIWFLIPLVSHAAYSLAVAMHSAGLFLGRGKKE